MNTIKTPDQARWDFMDLGDVDCWVRLVANDMTGVVYAIEPVEHIQGGEQTQIRVNSGTGALNFSFGDRTYETFVPPEFNDQLGEFRCDLWITEDHGQHFSVEGSSHGGEIYWLWVGGTRGVDWSKPYLRRIPEHVLVEREVMPSARPRSDGKTIASFGTVLYSARLLSDDALGLEYILERIANGRTQSGIISEDFTQAVYDPENATVKFVFGGRTFETFDCPQPDEENPDLFVTDLWITAIDGQEIEINDAEAGGQIYWFGVDGETDWDVPHLRQIPQK